MNERPVSLCTGSCHCIDATPGSRLAGEWRLEPAPRMNSAPGEEKRTRSWARPRMASIRGWDIVRPIHSRGGRHAQVFFRRGLVGDRVVGSCIGADNSAARSCGESGSALQHRLRSIHEGKTPGTLDARWDYGNSYSGRGVATGGPATGGFAGRYHVRYFLETGAFSDEYDLDIAKHAGGDFYDVTWTENGAVAAKGVGMEVPNNGGLAVGWRRVAD